jgi:hypothetical protein
MIILDENNNKVLTSLLVLLTAAEAQELMDKLRRLDPTSGDHIHINDEKFTKEITVAVYTPDNLKFFSKHVRHLVESEKQ